ncbi:MAG TPA: hypothetical protein VK110_10185 [Salinisphaeraceae bacterium]|nr:hypothetical protein [Salinisphaeraceae bacterium]
MLASACGQAVYCCGTLIASSNMLFSLHVRESAANYAKHQSGRHQPALVCARMMVAEAKHLRLRLPAASLPQYSLKAE